jgi:hypothetical protein
MGSGITRVWCYSPPAYLISQLWRHDKGGKVGMSLLPKRIKYRFKVESERREGLKYLGMFRRRQQELSRWYRTAISQDTWYWMANQRWCLAKSWSSMNRWRANISCLKYLTVNLHRLHVHVLGECPLFGSSNVLNEGGVSLAAYNPPWAHFRMRVSYHKCEEQHFSWLVRFRPDPHNRYDIRLWHGIDLILEYSHWLGG